MDRAKKSTVPQHDPQTAAGINSGLCVSMCTRAYKLLPLRSMAQGQCDVAKELGFTALTTASLGQWFSRLTMHGSLQDIPGAGFPQVINILDWIILEQRCPTEMQCEPHIF